MNFSAYLRKNVVSTYAVSTELMAAEREAFALAGAKLDGDVLDIGVGTGRTSPHLNARARRYVAIDFSPAMVAECRLRHPGVDVSVGDARDLARFADQEFDFVLFSYNGIDYVEPGERPATLRGIRRVLRRDGIFVYSSHNVLALEGRLPEVHIERPPPSPGLLEMGWRWGGCMLRNARRMRNRARIGAGRFLSEDLARVNDSGADHAFLTVYVSRRHEESALAAAGFVLLRVLDCDGKEAAAEASDPWLYYVARASS